jgi:hypothetical protein
LCFSCILPKEDPFRSCFGCEDSSSRAGQDHNTFTEYIDRQTGEMFQATSQNRRVICTTGAGGGQRCRLRIDRAMQFRGVSYGRALQFIQSEQYLGEDDLGFLRYLNLFFNKKK